MQMLRLWLEEATQLVGHHLRLGMYVSKIRVKTFLVGHDLANIEGELTHLVTERKSECFIGKLVTSIHER